MGKSFFYAVAKGATPGIYHTWEACSLNVTGHSQSVFKKFSTREEAVQFMVSHGAAHHASGGSGGSGHTGASHQRATHSTGIAMQSSSSSARSSIPAPPAVSQPVISSQHPPSEESIQRRLRSAVTQVYVDGACRENGKRGAKGGYGGFYGKNDPRNFSLPLLATEKQTNNRAEMKAIIHVLRTELERLDAAKAKIEETQKAHAQRQQKESRKRPRERSASIEIMDVDNSDDDDEVRQQDANGSGQMLHHNHQHQRASQFQSASYSSAFHPLRIMTDSKYCCNGINVFIHAWERNGFTLSTKKPVENQDLWKAWRELEKRYQSEYAKALFAQLQEEGNEEVTRRTSENALPRSIADEAKTFAVQYKHVRGHAGCYGNEMADRLAVKGAEMEG